MKRFFLLTMIFAVMFTACQDSNKATSGYQKTSNGLLYKFYSQNDGKEPQMNELMEVEIACTINDTVVILPKGRNILQLVEPMFAGDIFEGLKMMRIGDSASFIVRTDSTFNTLFHSPMPSEFSNDDVMRFDVKLYDFYPESEYFTKRIEYMKNSFPQETEAAETELKQYFKDNKIKPEQTETGLYYTVVEEGNGEKPQVGTMINVHYTGKLLDGTVFDSSVEREEPFQFVLGIGQVIQGWDEGLQLMSKGEKAVLYIPYYLAYGPNGSGPIPPFATLIFEVELIEF